MGCRGLSSREKVGKAARKGRIRGHRMTKRQRRWAFWYSGEGQRAKRKRRKRR